MMVLMVWTKTHILGRGWERQLARLAPGEDLETLRARVLETADVEGRRAAVEDAVARRLRAGVDETVAWLDAGMRLVDVDWPYPRARARSSAA